MKPESIEFLRANGVPEHAIAILESEHPATITGDVLASFLRASYTLGRQSMRDHFVWHDVADLIADRQGIAG